MRIWENGISEPKTVVFVPDSASSTGAGKTGLTHSSAGLWISVRPDNASTVTNYKQADGNIEDITTLGTWAAPTTNKCRFKEVDATGQPGMYELQFAAAIFGTANAQAVSGMIHGASGGAPIPFLVQQRPVPSNVTQWAGSATPVTGITLVYATDFATVYDTTNKAFLSKLGNFAMGGSSLALTLGAVSCTTISTSGTVTLNALTVSNATTLTGVVTATNASNNLRLGTFTVDINNVVWNASWDTEVQSECADALTAYGAATSAQINSLAVNTRANLQIPVEIENPDASTLIYKIKLYLFDVEGNMEAPDSTPTVALTNAAGTDRSARLSAASNPSTGGYSWDYTATVGDAEEQLNWLFTVVEGGLTRVYPATTYVVEETAYRFSSTDRANLVAALADTNELQTDWANGGRLDLILDARASQASVDAEAIKTTAIQSSLTTIVNRIGAWTGSGINTILGAFRAIAAKAAALTPTDLSDGTTFVNTSDSLEAIRDRGDAAWTTGGGGGGGGTESDLMLSTTIASVTSQTVLVLTDGSPDNDAYNIGQIVIITDAATAEQKARCLVSDYVGSSKTLTLSSAPLFIVAAGDAVAILAVGTTLSESSSAVVVVQSEDVTIASFPATLNIGDSYDEDNALRLYLRDENNDPVTAAIGHNFTDPDFAPTVIIAPGPGDRGRVVAVVTYVVPGGAAENYLKVEIPIQQSRRAVEGVSTVQCALVWGTSTRKTLITTTVDWLQKL